MGRNAPVLRVADDNNLKDLRHLGEDLEAVHGYGLPRKLQVLLGNGRLQEVAMLKSLFSQLHCWGMASLTNR